MGEFQHHLIAEICGHWSGGLNSTVMFVGKCARHEYPFFFFIGQVDLGTHTLSSTQKSFNFTVETRLQINITFQVLLGGLKKIDT